MDMTTEPSMPRARPSTRRLDQRLVDEGLAADLHAAQGLVLAGKVMVGEQKVDKAGTQVRDDRPVRLIGGPPSPYVSRGGHKLEGALRALRLDVAGLRCVDVGAATGGFSDCLLQHGADAVVAVDVGHGLLHPRLRADPRVLVLERTHIRSLEPGRLPWPADLVVMDVSFIGARQVLPTLLPLLRAGGRMLVLVKPQFEAAREQVGPGGVVRDDEVRWQAVAEVERVAEVLGLQVLGRAESEVAGPAGNREIFLLLRKPGELPRTVDGDPR